MRLQRSLIGSESRQGEENKPFESFAEEDIGKSDSLSLAQDGWLKAESKNQQS